MEETMRHRRSIPASVLVGLVLLGAALLPACRRAPETPPPEVVATPVPEAVAYPHGHPLTLPQTNDLIEITLSSAPDTLVATYNDQGFLELTDTSRPSLHFTFEADLPTSPSRSPSDLQGFQELLGKYDGGHLLDSGSFDTALGPATWAFGEYYQEDRTFSDVRIFAPHPSGNGRLILSSTAPEGTASPEERLETMRQLLAGVS
jgi:hypothetical protein